ncbi:MAG TPA: putative porin [Bacteroidota bacterium]|nr:putative porin [Bacteroidota bacterium]
MKHSITGILLLTLFLLAHARAQFDQTDSTAATTTPPADTLRHFTVPIPYVGSIERSPTVLVTDSSINFMDYTYSGSLLSMVPGVFIRSLASPGQHHGITIDGLDDRNIAFMSDGVLLNEPFTGTFDPYLYPTEHIERVEIITGPRAFLYGLNSTGMAVNFVSKNKKAIHASTRIRYQESSYGQGFVDGMFSQDIIRGLNMTAGAQHASYGGRYPNSDYDAWNGRMKLRYNVSNRLDFFASGMYNQTRLGLNGGIDISKTPDSTRYDRLLAVVADSNAYEKVTRYDLQVGMAGNFFADTTATTMLTLYHSTNFREYRDNENNPGAGYVKEDTRSQWYGAKVTQHFESGYHNFDFGADISRRGIIARDLSTQSLNTYYAFTGKWEYRPLDNSLAGAGYARFDNITKLDSRISFGAEIRGPILPWLMFSGGGSVSPRFRSLVEYNNPLFLGNTTEDIAVVQVGLGVRPSSSSSIDVMYDYRYIYGLPEFSNGEIYSIPDLDRDLTVQALHLAGSWRLGSYLIRCSIMKEETSVERTDDVQARGYQRIFPKWSGTGEFYFWDKLFNGHLDLKTGFRVKGFTAFQASGYNSEYQLFTTNNDPGIPGTATLDFILIAHIGSAYVHLVMENLLDRKYVITSFYPMNERNLRFGLSWDFLD